MTPLHELVVMLLMMSVSGLIAFPIAIVWMIRNNIGRTPDDWRDALPALVPLGAALGFTMLALVLTLLFDPAGGQTPFTMLGEPPCRTC